MKKLLLTSNKGIATFIASKKDWEGAESWEVTQSWQEYEQLRNLENYSQIFVQVELEWKNYSPMDQYGFRILKDIRLEKKIKCPIILLSGKCKDWFLNENKVPVYQVIKTSGHHYIQLPAAFWEEDLHELEDLDDDSLYDIIDSFFLKEGYIDEVLHGLKNLALPKKEDIANPRKFYRLLEEEVRSCFERIMPNLDAQDDQILVIRDNLLETLYESIITKGSLGEAILVVSQYEGQIKRFLPKEERINVEAKDKYNWEVLLIEDEQAPIDFIKKAFKNHGITCHYAKNGTAAYRILNEDEKFNRITVVICDYRLLRPNGEWQRNQGYTIIKNIFENKPNFISFFALTSFNRRTLLRMQSNLGMQIWAYSKVDVLHDVSAFNVFVEKVIEEGEKYYDIICSQPKCKNWENKYEAKFDCPLKAYYKKMRGQKNFDQINRRIENEAEEFLYEVWCEKQNPKHDPKMFKKEYQAKITIDNFQQFEINMIGRRVAIALYHTYELSKGIVYWTLKTGRLGKKEDKAVSGFFTTFLALSLEKDIPDNLLPEEKHWLQYFEKRYLSNAIL